VILIPKKKIHARTRRKKELTLEKICPNPILRCLKIHVESVHDEKNVKLAILVATGL
jgi:hypothetical protein